MKFIYFDIGGVLDKDFSATYKWDLLTSEWNISKPVKEKIDKLFIEFEKEACVGRSVEDFLSIMNKKFGIKFPKNYSLNENFVNLFDKNEGIKKIIDQIKNKYELGLLTNMYPGMFKMIRDKNLIPNIDWKVIIDSSVEKYKKPEMEIYKIAEKRSKTKANEILFIDNNQENLIVPKKLGWQTFWFKSVDYDQSNRELEEFLG